MPEPDEEKLDACILCSARDIAVIDGRLNLCACRDCGLVFDNPRPRAASLKAYYSKPEKYDQWLSREQERDALWRRRLRKMAGQAKSGTLLDIGAGTGQFLAHARKRFSMVAGTEISASAIRVAKERYQVELFEGNIETIDFGGRTFDCITLFHVLEHVPYPTAFLKRCAALLSPGGTLFVAVPNELRSLRERAKGAVKRLLRLAGIRRFQRYGRYGFSKIEFTDFHTEIHLSHFTEKTVVASAERAGLSVKAASLDPSFARPFPLDFLEATYYRLLTGVYGITGLNVYDTVWIAAGKAEASTR
jgi:ubiquinone/menaquinone biosynthesis C-methylase UbiE